MLPKICDLFLKRKATIKAAHGYIQDYNGQALLDSKHQVIIHGEPFWDGQDYEHVPPMLDGAKDNVEALGHGEDYFSGKMLVADINYHSYNEESDRYLCPIGRFLKLHTKKNRNSGNLSGQYGGDAQDYGR